MCIGETSFIPFRNEKGQVNTIFEDASEHLETIFSSYVNLRERPIQNCAIVSMKDRTPQWSLKDGDQDTVQKNTLLLFLAAVAENEYLSHVSSYANASMFQLYWQRFSIPPEYLAIESRRRDGSTTDGGYKHGEVKFPIPREASSPFGISIDKDFCDGLSRALSADLQIIKNILAAMSFFSLASTDSSFMRRDAETILMGSAFEQLFSTDGAYKLCKRFGELFNSYGTVNVQRGLETRHGIQLDSRHEESQKQWFMHQKWIEELYDLRSCYIHGEALKNREWGWLPPEPLIMAAFVFPLVVKIMLSNEEFYTLSRREKGSCRAVDKLLAQTEWYEDNEDRNSTNWQTILGESRWNEAFEDEN